LRDGEVGEVQSGHVGTLGTLSPWLVVGARGYYKRRNARLTNEFCEEMEPPWCMVGKGGEKWRLLLPGASEPRLKEQTLRA